MKRQSCLVAVGLALAPVFVVACGGSEQTGPHAAGPGASRYARLPAELGGVAAEPNGAASASATPSAGAPAAQVGGPKLKRADVLGGSDRVAGLTAVHIGDRRLLAWTTYAQPSREDWAPASGPGKSSAAKASAHANTRARAKVMVRLLDRSLSPLGTPVTVSASAESVGGIAAAAGRADREEACIAWIEADGTSKQIGLALVGRDGKTFARRVQTGGKLAPSDVALAPTGDGWVVGWVDQRDGVPQVYAARVTPELKILAPERRLSHGSGEPSEVQVLVHGDTTLVAWNTVEGDSADVYVTALHGGDLRMGEETRVGTVKGTAHGVRLGAIEDRAVIGWVETPADDSTSHSQTTGRQSRRGDRRSDPNGSSRRDAVSGSRREAGASSNAGAAGEPTAPLRQDPTDRATLLLIPVDWNASTVGTVQKVPLSQGIRSMALGCQTGRCRIATGQGSAASAAIEVGGLVWDGNGAPPPVAQLMTLQDVAPEDMSPVLIDDFLVFAEDTLQGQGRLRRLHIEWP